ncbi:hypothetical protein C7B89_08600 [Lysinibacillus capsici]|nr:hypothetical protein C7B89_08600 [Lysinibacillus capsici]
MVTRSNKSIVLKNKTTHKIFLEGENGLPLQATCFPVGERRTASFAPLRLAFCLTRYPTGVK